MKPSSFLVYAAFKGESTIPILTSPDFSEIEKAAMNLPKKDKAEGIKIFAFSASSLGNMPVSFIPADKFSKPEPKAPDKPSIQPVQQDLTETP